MRFETLFSTPHFSLIVLKFKSNESFYHYIVLSWSTIYPHFKNSNNYIISLGIPVSSECKEILAHFMHPQMLSEHYWSEGYRY